MQNETLDGAKNSQLRLYDSSNKQVTQQKGEMDGGRTVTPKKKDYVAMFGALAFLAILGAGLGAIAINHYVGFDKFSNMVKDLAEKKITVGVTAAVAGVSAVAAFGVGMLARSYGGTIVKAGATKTAEFREWLTKGFNKLFYGEDTGGNGNTGNKDSTSDGLGQTLNSDDEGEGGESQLNKGK